MDSISFRFGAEEGSPVREVFNLLWNTIKTLVYPNFSRAKPLYIVYIFSFISTFTMVRSQINDLDEGIVSGLLKQSISYRKIVKQVKQMGYSVFVGCYIKARFEKTFAKLAKLEYFQNTIQPPMLTSFEISTIWSNLWNRQHRERNGIDMLCIYLFNLSLNIWKQSSEKKCRLHRLSEAQILKRRARWWHLYIHLNCGKWKNLITTHEAMFCMGGRVANVFAMSAFNNSNMTHLLQGLCYGPV